MDDEGATCYKCGSTNTEYWSDGVWYCNKCKCTFEN